MSQITPNKLYELYKKKKINKSEFINRLITIYEFSDSEEIRVECLNTIDDANIKTENLFKFLEEVVLSDPNIEVRLNATSLALKNYPENGYNLINYLFNSSESKVFIARIAKIIGERMITSDNNITNELSNSLKSKILEIFENEDVKSFEILWGDWFHKTFEGFWNFLLEIKDPIGYLEILDYFISNNKIYYWFYNYIFTKLTFEQLILFLNNSRVAGRLFYILSFLEEEKPPVRFYQIIELFEQFGKNLTLSQINKIKDLIKKNNHYTLVLILIFHWLYHFNLQSIKDILEDSDLNLILKMTEVIKSNRFGIFTHDYFLYSVVLFLLKISKEIDEKYIDLFFNHIPLRIRDNLVSKLSKIVVYKENYKNNNYKTTHFLKIKTIFEEFLEIVSNYYDIK